MTPLKVFNYNSQAVPQLYSRHRVDITMELTIGYEFLLYFLVRVDRNRRIATNFIPADRHFHLQLVNLRMMILEKTFVRVT
jgi:hypothetical protein